jgi:hypothetical protein
MARVPVISNSNLALVGAGEAWRQISTFREPAAAPGWPALSSASARPSPACLPPLVSRSQYIDWSLYYVVQVESHAALTRQLNDGPAYTRTGLVQYASTLDAECARAIRPQCRARSRSSCEEAKPAKGHMSASLPAERRGRRTDRSSKVLPILLTRVGHAGAGPSERHYSRSEAMERAAVARASLDTGRARASSAPALRAAARPTVPSRLGRTRTA